MKVEISALFRGSLTDLALNRATRRVSAGVDLGRTDRGMEIRLLKSGPFTVISHAQIKVRRRHGNRISSVTGKYLDSTLHSSTSSVGTPPG